MKIASMAIAAAVIAILPIQLVYSLGMALHSCGCATTAPAFLCNVRSKILFDSFADTLEAKAAVRGFRFSALSTFAICVDIDCWCVGLALAARLRRCCLRLGLAAAATQRRIICLNKSA